MSSRDAGAGTTRVFIAGATGVLGRRLLAQFRSRGHVVVGLARSDANVRAIESLGAEARRADLFDAASVTRAAAECDVIIRAATAIPKRARTRRADWEANDRIRRAGTQALTAAAANVGAHAFLQESIVWLVRSPDGAPFDEDAPPRPDPMLVSSLDAEKMAREAGERAGFAAMVLRFGLFYAHDAAHVRAMGDGLLRRRTPILGDGSALWSLVYVDDAASAFVAAAETPRSGLWHVVDDRPVRMDEFLRAFARRLGAREPRRVPVWLARLVVGRLATDFLVSSFPTSNSRFRRDFRWRPSYPTYAEGLDQVVSAWKAEGFPAARTP